MTLHQETCADGSGLHPEVWEALGGVLDPELDCSIVDLGLVYSVERAGPSVRVVMTVTSPGCPMQGMLEAGVQAALLQVDGVEDVQVRVVFDPPWGPQMMTPAGRSRTGVR